KERSVDVGNVGAEDVVEARGVDRHLYAAVGQLRRAHERAHGERRKASLQVVDRLALVGHNAGDVHEPGYLVRAAGHSNHSTAIRMADEHHGTFDLVDDRRREGSVVGNSAQRVRRSENGVTVADEPVIHRPPAGRVSERAVNENNGGTGHDEFLSSHGQLGCPLLDSSGDFFEVAEAEGPDHLGLHGRDVFVGLVGAERRANDGADSAAALGLTDELDDGLRDIVRIWGVLALERRCQGRDHGVGDAADLAIGLGDFDACGRLNVGEKVGRVSARLHRHDLDAEQRDFVPEAVGQRFDRDLARAVNADEGERYAAEDRADVDDQAVVLPAHGGEHGAGDAKQPDDIRVEDRLRLFGSEGFGYADRGDAGVVDEHIDLAGLGQHCLDAGFDRRIVADVQLHGLDAELA